MPEMNHRLSALERRLGHRFTDQDLIELALTHASMTRTPASSKASRRKRKGKAGRNNERLEFLGDRVLGLIVAHALMRLHPDDPEGALTDRHVALVKRDKLAEIAQEIGLDNWVRLARGEEDMGGRGNPAILADCLEAVIGALYLDGGLETASHFVERHWREHLEALRRPPRDPKMALQEWAHAHAKPAPVYDTIEREGPPHAPVFAVRVEIADAGEAMARARSKRAAEQTAAKALLARLKSS